MLLGVAGECDYKEPQQESNVGLVEAQHHYIYLYQAFFTV